MINVSKSYAIDPIKIFMMNNVHIEKEVEKSSFQRDSMKRWGGGISLYFSEIYYRTDALKNLYR